MRIVLVLCVLPLFSCGRQEGESSSLYGSSAGNRGTVATQTLEKTRSISEYYCNTEKNLVDLPMDGNIYAICECNVDGKLIREARKTCDYYQNGIDLHLEH